MAETEKIDLESEVAGKVNNHPNADVLEHAEKVGGEKMKISHSLANNDGTNGNRNFDADDFDF